MTEEPRKLDQLDTELIRTLTDHPRTGFLELSRLTGVSRATVQARVQRLEESGVITGYGPDLDLAAAGYPVLAFVSLEIAQGGLDLIAQELARVPEILEAYGTTGPGDVNCRVAARSHDHLQDTLIRINRIASVVRSTSVIALSRVVPPRRLPLLDSDLRPRPSRVPAYRTEGTRQVPPRPPE